MRIKVDLTMEEIFEAVAMLIGLKDCQKEDSPAPPEEKCPNTGKPKALCVCDDCLEKTRYDRER